MQKEHGIISPVIPHGENRRLTRCDQLEVTPADFGYLLAHSNDALRPIQHGVRVAPLRGVVNMLIAEWARLDDRDNGFVTLGESCLRFIRPLHWRSSALPLRQRQIISH